MYVVDYYNLSANHRNLTLRVFEIRKNWDPSDDEGMEGEPDEVEIDASGDEADDAEDGHEGDDNKRSKFRFSARNLGLTYPQTGGPLDSFVATLKARMAAKNIPWGKLVVGKEKHHVTGEHFHVYIGFIKRVNYKNVRLFDLVIEGKERHPNWKTLPVGGAMERWIWYCKKGGKFHQEGFLEVLGLLKDPKGYRNKKADIQLWEQDAERQQLQDPFPFKLPDGTDVKAPLPADRRINWLILGPPGCGKTYWCETTFEDKKVYKRPKGMAKEKQLYPYDRDMYQQEQVVIMDDFVPAMDELIAVSDCYNTLTHVYGRSRYGGNWWKKKQRRVIIWILNPQRLPPYAKPGDERYEIFKTRFNFMKAVKNGNDWDWQRIDDTVQHVQNEREWINGAGL